MTALIFSVLLLVYVIVPGIGFRRIFHICVPLRRIQWSRTDELASFVITLFLPAAVAFALVNHTNFFSQHPFGFDDSTLLKWNDYKSVLSASYSEKYFNENRDMLLMAFERVCRRQIHFLTWYYATTFLWAWLCGLIAWQYGNIREWKIAYVVEKFMIPAVSEWHAMFTPFTFPHSPERWVQVDALSGDGTLYQGAAGIFHVGGDGKLTGFFIKSAKRFLRAEYTEAKKLDSAVSKERFWRVIPGETFYLPGDKISNLNFTYVPKEPLDTLAKDNLKKMNIDATVVIQPATAKVQPKEQPETPPPAQDVKPPEAKPTKPETELHTNFSVCKHCMLNGRPGLLPRVTQDTPVISRSDGRSYHIYLQYGPRLRPSPSGAVIPGVYLAHFRYALDSKKLRDEPVIVAINAANQPYPVVQIVGIVADKLAAMLEAGKVPARFYQWSAGSLTALAVKRGK
jgi:hypothetical protein